MYVCMLYMQLHVVMCVYLFTYEYECKSYLRMCLLCTYACGYVCMYSIYIVYTRVCMGDSFGDKYIEIGMKQIIQNIKALALNVKHRNYSN